MKLLIPRYLSEQRQQIRHSPAPRFGVSYGLHEVAGRRAAPADLVQILSKYRRSDLIRWVAAVGGWLARPGSLEPGNQLAMADQMLSELYRTGLREAVKRLGWERWCVFHRRQLWFLLQMALIAAHEGAPEADEATLRLAVGECLLMATDVIQQIEPSEPIGDGPDEANKWMASYVIPVLDGRDGHEVVARAQSFWFDLPAGLKDRFAALGVKDFDAAFAERYGLPLRDFFLVLFTLYIHFAAHAEQNGSPLLTDERTYLWPTFSEETVRKALALVAQTPDDLALRLLGHARQNWATDYTPLRGTPIIQVFDGRHACPDLGLLHRCLTDRVYFLLRDAYPEKAFNQLFGYVFEAYINRVIRRFAYDGDVLARQFYPSPFFKGTTDEAGDAILHWSRVALVMEYKSRLLTTREKYGGIQEATLAGIEDIVGKEKSKKGVDQLARVVRRMLAGEKVVAGSPKELVLKDGPRIHPVLVVYEEALGLEAIRQRAEAKFAGLLGGDGIAQGRVGKLLILTVHEVEILDHLALTQSAERVIEEYAEYVTTNPKDRAGSFLSFVTNRGYGQTTSNGRSAVDETYMRTLDEVIAELGRRTVAQAGPPTSACTAA